MLSWQQGSQHGDPGQCQMLCVAGCCAYFFAYLADVLLPKGIKIAARSSGVDALACELLGKVL
jgi:hypothetical protein